MDKNDLVFWTGIMADHAQFQINAFSPREAPYIQEAMMFQDTFREYHIAAQSEAINSAYLASVMNDVVRFIEFKKKIIIGLLRCNVLINFTPGFINHMVNEAMEFLSLMDNGPCPAKTQTPATYVKIWIADASGHASSILGSLDASETMLSDNAQSYKKAFDQIYKKSVELEMIQNNLNVYDQFNLLKSEAIQAMKQFVAFCSELGSLLNSCEVLAAGTFGPAIVNHFIREHEYVMEKLLQCV